MYNPAGHQNVPSRHNAARFLAASINKREYFLNVSKRADAFGNSGLRGAFLATLFEGDRSVIIKEAEAPHEPKLLR
jgi:hypothetical protein